GAERRGGSRRRPRPPRRRGLPQLARRDPDAPARRGARPGAPPRRRAAGARRRAGRARPRRYVPGRAARLPQLQLPDGLPRGPPDRGGRGLSRRVSARQLPLFLPDPPPPRLELVPDLPGGPAGLGPAGGEAEGGPPIPGEKRRAARELGADLVLRAGAGTGKTHTLVQAVAHLAAGATRLQRRVPVTSILVLTFSEKAAAELRERVRAKLLELAAAPRGDRALEEAYRRLGATPVGAAGWRAPGLALGAAPLPTLHR